MLLYKAPLQEIRFVLYEMLDYERTIPSLPGYEEATRDLVDDVVREIARFCESELLPLNGPGDQEGCRFENGSVRTPRGFKEAYSKFIQGGWTGLTSPSRYGGQGLPRVLQFVVEEIISSSNLSFGMYPGVSMMAAHLLELHGSEEQKRLFLPRLVDGSWSGTMCLTEPHCGSDLGLVQTRAEPDGPRYRISGTKIFITGGEHDLTENIVHLVLARLPGAPPGTRGLSLFIVPKFLPAPDGAPGERNAVSCGRIEEKMGLRASATCLMNFDGAEGYLVGEPHRGMRIMFAMMNEARLAVGVQSLGLAETAYQSAAAYAKERLQGRSLSAPKVPDKPADPIIVHPDVRKNLLTIRAYNEAARALALWVGVSVDIAARNPDPARRAEAEDLVSLMTPVVKAFCTDCGFEATNRALQVFGGSGYIRDTGIEQLVRDSRVAQIYEGTNGIQALDLVARKMPQHWGRLLRRFFHPVSRFIAANSEDPRLSEFVAPLSAAFARLQEITLWLAREGLRDREELGAASTDYLRLFALVVFGYMWAWTARIAAARLAEGDNEFYRTKLSLARFYMSRLLPQTRGLLAAIRAGAGPIMEIREEWF